MKTFRVHNNTMFCVPQCYHISIEKEKCSDRKKGTYSKQSKKINSFLKEKIKVKYFLVVNEMHNCLFTENEGQCVFLNNEEAKRSLSFVSTSDKFGISIAAMSNIALEWAHFSFDK
jgi:hypothetical protein